MKPEQFCFWLQGFFEIAGPTVKLNSKQVTIIQNHLNLVFIHSIDPKLNDEIPASNGTSKEQLVKYWQDIHDGKIKVTTHENEKPNPIVSLPTQSPVLPVIGLPFPDKPPIPTFPPINFVGESEASYRC